MQKIRVEDLKEEPIEQIIDKAVKSRENTIQRSNEMDEKYERLLSDVDTEDFMTLIPDTVMSKALERLLDLKSNFLALLGTEYRTSHAFSMLDPSYSTEEQAVSIGDPDDFFDFVMNSNDDYLNQLAWCINEISEVAMLLKHGMEGSSTEMGTHLADFIQQYASIVLEGVTIRPFLPPVTEDEKEL